MSFKAVSIAVLLAGMSIGSSAITLGKVRGAAWIGQGLDVTVPVQLEGAAADRGVCAEADIFHADSRQDNSRIRITTEPSDQGDAVNVRIVSSAPVDEPVVTIYVRAGCTQKVSRRYVFLADLPDVASPGAGRTPSALAPPVPFLVVTENPSSASAASSTAIAPAVSPGTGVTAAPGQGGDPGARTIARLLQTQPEAVSAKPSKPPAVQKTAPAAKPAATARPQSQDRPRLKLDPLDGLFGRIKPPSETAQPAAPEPPLELREGESLSQLQASIKAQLAQSAKSEAQLLAIRERLEKAESERVPLALVYALVAMLVLCLGGFAFLGWKRFSAKNDPSDL